MADISSNLLYYYKFDREDIKGLTLKNHATGAYDAILSSTSVISNENYYIGNSAFNLISNLSQNVTISNVSCFNSNFSVSLWISSLNNQIFGIANRRIIEYSADNGTNILALLITSNVFRIYSSVGTTTDIHYGINVNNGIWTHFVLSFELASKTLRLFMNGKLQNQQIIANNLSPATSGTLAIGSNTTSASKIYYRGSIDDFRIYNYAISSQEDVNYLFYYPNYKIYKNSLSSASLLSKLSSNFYDTNNQNIIFDNEPRNIIPGTIVLLSGKPTTTASNLGNYVNSVTYSSISQAIFNSDYSSLYVVDDISGSISIINTQSGKINVLPTMDSASKTVEDRYELNAGIKSIAFDTSQTYYYVTNGSYVQQMNYTTNNFAQNINIDALTNINYCITDSNNILYISHATGINEINLSEPLPTTTTNIITTTVQMSQLAISSKYPNTLYAIDNSNIQIYVINTTTNANYNLTLPASFMYSTVKLTSICFDTNGNLYISTTNGTYAIYMIPKYIITTYSANRRLTTTEIILYAGKGGTTIGTTGYSGDGTLCSNALFKNISNITMDNGNNMYICDSSNATIRKVINKPQNTNYLNTIKDEMNISSQYDISTLYSPSYSFGVNEPSNYCIGSTSTRINDNIHSSNYNIIDNSGLILYYRFNSQDVSGLNLANYSTGFPVYDASLSIAGLVNSRDYVLDNAALNIPTTDYVTINNSKLTTGINSTSVFNTNGLSFTCWVKSNNTGTNGRIFEFGNQVSASNFIIIFIVSNRLQGAIKINGGAIYYDTGYTINNNIWHHICYTLTYSTGSTSTHKVYVDGTIIYQTTTGVYPNSAVTYPYCYIGKSTYAVDPYFNGIIDDFRFYNRILSLSEIKTLYNSIKNQNVLIDLTTIGAVPTLPTSTTANSTTTISTDETPIKNGTYTMSCSVSRSTIETASYAFDGVTTSTNYWRTNQIYNTDGSYPGTTNTTVEGLTINGEWLQIQIPYMLKLTSYTLTNTTLDVYQLVGSNDGSTWYNIDKRDAVTPVVGNVTVNLSSYLNTTTQSWNYKELNQAYYSYYRIIIIWATNINLQRAQVGEFDLYGIGKYTQNNPSTNTYSLTSYDTIPVLTNTTTVISDYTPIILNGTYIASQSSALTTGQLGYRVFDYNVDTFWQSSISYSSSVYVGAVTTTFKNTTTAITISGEWLQIQLPYSISITGYTLLPRSSTQLSQFPKQWYLVGSNDGLNWYAIDYKTAITPTYTYLSYGNGYANKNYYSYFRLIVMAINTNSTTVVSISQMQLIGTGKSITTPNTYTDTITTDYAVPALTSTVSFFNGFIYSLLNGIYISSASSVYLSNNTYSSYRAFDYNTNSFWNSTSIYNTSTNNGSYTGTVTTYITDTGQTQAGEWIQIQLPYVLSLTGYSILPRGSSFLFQFPKKWFLVGSNDGTTWYAIDFQSYTTISSYMTYYSGNSYQNTNYYSYFRLIILNIVGTTVNTGITINEIQLQGIGM